MAEMTDKDTSGFVAFVLAMTISKFLGFILGRKKNKNKKTLQYFTQTWGVGTGNNIAYANLFFVFVFVLLLLFFDLAIRYSLDGAHTLPIDPPKDKCQARKVSVISLKGSVVVSDQCDYCVRVGSG